MRSSAALVGAIVGVVALAGCGSSAKTPPAACTADARDVENAAIASAALPDGTKLSDCVADAQSDGDLQAIALIFTMAGDQLAFRAKGDPKAARAVGFLVGAGRRGAKAGHGVAAELSNRLGTDVRRVHETAPDQDFAVARGIADGRARG